MQCGPKRTHYFRPSARQTKMAIEKDPVGVFILLPVMRSVEVALEHISRFLYCCIHK